MTPEFERALAHVLADFRIKGEECSELVAVGVQRQDCWELFADAIRDEPQKLVAAFVAVQWGVAVGVHIERARWDPNHNPPEEDS